MKTPALLPKKNDNRTKENNDISKVGITAIVLSDNRKCIHNNHILQDVKAELRIVTPYGKIIDYYILAAYCNQCDKYFVLKCDFKDAQRQGVILCPVEDRTQAHLQKMKSKKTYAGESRIHQLGYNVKKNNGYTTEQRQIVLANIIENTNISKHEIQSTIDRCVRQHQTQSNYAKAVENWINDYRFVTKYKKGDMQQIIIEKIIIGKRR